MWFVARICDKHGHLKTQHHVVNDEMVLTSLVDTRQGSTSIRGIKKQTCGGIRPLFEVLATLGASVYISD